MICHVGNKVIYRQLPAWIERLSRLSLAGVMFYAGVSKLFDPVAFTKVIGAYGLLPDFFLLPAAIALPVFEMIAALLLISGRISGLWLTAFLMILFIAVLSYGIWLGLDIDCGCFAPEVIEHKAFSSLRSSLIRDLLLGIPILYCFGYSCRLTSNQRGE